MTGDGRASGEAGGLHFYLDANATAPLRPEAHEAMAEALAEVGNASSVHGFGRRARRLIEDAREAVAALVGATPAGVVFTGSGTEANNLALTGTGRRRILISAIEHESILQAASNAETIPVREDGRLDLAALEASLRASDEPALLSVMLANNETGVLQPLAEATRLAKAAGALVHCDAVQAVGRIPLEGAALDIDLMSLSAHKLGGPQGVGALVLWCDVPISPLLRGGGQERGRRAGTENVAGISGFGAAAKAALRDLSQSAAQAAWRDRLEASIAAWAPDAVFAGKDAPRLPNTSCFAVPGLKAETQLMALDLAGYAVSAGAACSSGKVQISHVLRAMGFEEALAASAIRVSLGWHSREADLDAFALAWRELYDRKRAQAAASAA